MICIKCLRTIPDGSKYCNFCGKKQAAEKRRRTKRANGNGGAWKRGSTFTAVWTNEKSDLAEDGRIIQHRRTKGGFKTRREAEEYAMLMSQSKVRPQDAPTLKHYWEQYSTSAMLKLSENKIRSYKHAWERLAPLHGRNVDAIFTADMQSVIDSAVDTYYAAKDMKTVLGTLYEYAAAEGWASKDLPDLINLPEHEGKEREPFTQDELKKLWESYCSGNENVGMALVMIYTGLMPGEVMKLKPTDIDDETQTVSAGIGLKTKVRKKNGVILNEEASAIIKERIANLPEKEKYIYYGTKERFYPRYYDALKQAGVRELSPYSCRHTTATILALKRKDIPAEAIKRVMRWSTIRMLDVYAHPDIDDARQAVGTIRLSKTVDNHVDNKSEPTGIEEN